MIKCLQTWFISKRKIAEKGKKNSYEFKSTSLSSNCRGRVWYSALVQGDTILSW